MPKVTTTVTFPSTSRDLLIEVLREGAQHMLNAAIEAEVAEWIEAHRHFHDSSGHLQAVCNGYLLPADDRAGGSASPKSAGHAHAASRWSTNAC